MRERYSSLQLISMELFPDRKNTNILNNLPGMICSLMTLTPVRSAGCQHGLTGCSGDVGHHKVGGGGGGYVVLSTTRVCSVQDLSLLAGVRAS